MRADQSMSACSCIHGILDPVQRRRAIMLFGLMLIGMLLEMLGIGLVVPAMTLLMQDDLVGRFPAFRPVVAWLGFPDQRQLIIVAVSALVGIYFVKNTFLGFLGWRQAKFAYSVQAALAERLFEIYLRQPYIFHLQHNSAQLIRNVTTEASFFASHALIPGLLLLAESLVLCGIGLLLLAVEPFGALLVAAVVGGISLLFYRIIRTRLTRWGEARQFHEGMRLQQIQQGLGGAKDVRLLGREADFLRRFRTHNASNARVAAFQAGLQPLPRLWLEFLAVSGLALLAISMLAHERDIASIVPTLGLFAAAAFRLMPSVSRMLTSAQGLRYGLPVVRILHAELQRRDEGGEVQRPAGASGRFAHEVSISNLVYAYPGCPEPVVSGMSLQVRKGETVGLIGTSGAGKSTLVDLVLGLLDPASGSIKVDGRDIRFDLRGWQDQIGYVPQAIFLTDDTLRRNVAFGVADADIDEEAVARAIAFAQLDTFVAALPDGLDTIVGERGVRLSGGQRQRIGIARALYHNPPILVMDEATSALDVTTEKDVMDAVNAMHGDKTVLVVAHRLSTVARCDRIYRIEAGRVVEEGSPQTVLAVRDVADRATGQ